ncbi:hypothetical protein, conserved, partial [Babesia bigemina]
MEDKPVTEQLENWQGIAGLYVQDVKKCVKALMHIDNNLLNKLTPKCELIKKVVDNFWTSMTDVDVSDSVEELDSKFDQQRRDVKNNIAAKIGEFHSKLNIKLEDIRKQIEHIRQTKNAQISAIHRAVSEALQLAETLIDGKTQNYENNYQNYISRNFDEIKTEVEEFTKNDGAGIKSRLWSEFDTLQGKLRSLNTDVQHGLDALKKEIEELDIGSLVSDALSELEEAKSELHECCIRPIKEAAENFSLQYKNGSKEKIETLSTQLRSFREAIYGEGGTTVEPKSDSIAKFIADLIKAIGISDEDDELSALEQALIAFEKEAERQIQEVANKAVDDAGRQISKNDTATPADVEKKMKLFHDSHQALQNVVNDINVQLEALKAISQFVATQQSKSTQKLIDLKKEITGIKAAIANINQPIKVAGETFNSAVQLLTKSLTNAQRTVDTDLPVLTNALQERAKEAFDDLEGALKKTFNAQKKAELKVTQHIVATCIPEIKKLIATDFSTGLKGLMNRLHSTFNRHNLQNVSNVSLEIFSNKAKEFFTKFFNDFKDQPDLSDLSPDRLTPLTDALSALLSTMHTQRHFHADVSLRLAELQAALATLTPSGFAEASPLLNVVRAGVTAFHGELAKQYVSRYSGETFGAELVEKDKLTPYGTKLSKLFLSVVSTLRSSLASLRRGSRNLSGQQATAFSDLARLVADQGYDVCDSTTEQNGEVKRHLTGKGIQMYLVGNDYNHVYHTDNNVRRPLENMYIYLNDYYKIGHIATSSSKRRPCSIYEMLCWLSGLPCNDVYEDLWRDAVSELFVDPKNQPTENGDIPVTVVSEQPPRRPPLKIECNEAQIAVKRLCSRAYDVLTEIIGYGDAYTIYAVDLCNNSLNLHYPTDAASCLELLLDILRRLLPVFRFLHSQCKLGTKHFGWSNCLYGKDILNGKSHCDKHPDDKQTDCLPRSPLQAYLSDTLTGHLPHHVTSIGCKSVCSNCPKGLPGQPCLTPLGFRGFSGSTKPGKHLSKVLTNFFDKLDVTPIFGLMTKPPSTLPEHFQFALSLSNMLKNDGSRTNDVKTAFDTSAREESIDL